MTTQHTDEMRDKYAETIRCMSVVFDDIAAMLNLPKEQYGDPDALMDAIEELQAATASAEAKYLPVIKKLVSQMIKSAEYLNIISRTNPAAGFASDEIIDAIALAEPLLRGK